MVTPVMPAGGEGIVMVGAGVIGVEVMVETTVMVVVGGAAGEGFDVV